MIEKVLSGSMRGSRGGTLDNQGSAD
jgi:hypothetical protein